MSKLGLGADFAGCRIEEVIGRGGMGVIYRGTDLRLGRPVAIKLIVAEHAGDPSVRRRFEREARLMAAIDHPNVIPVYAAGEQDGHLYLVMRYVPGTDLHAVLRRQGRLAPAEAARIVGQVADALDAAHACGLVHRDIKPANVLLAGAHAYLTDFGITRAIASRTRITETNEWVGTVDFMSPEHLRGRHTDLRSDVYSLGCLLFTCLTGAPPFSRETTPATILAHLNERPPTASRSSGVPRRFDAVLSRALAKRPADRYQSAGELGRAALAAADVQWFSTRRRRLTRSLPLAGASRAGDSQGGASRAGEPRAGVTRLSRDDQPLTGVLRDDPPTGVLPLRGGSDDRPSGEHWTPTNVRQDEVAVAPLTAGGAVGQEPDGLIDGGAAPADGLGAGAVPADGLGAGAAPADGLGAGAVRSSTSGSERLHAGRPPTRPPRTRIWRTSRTRHLYGLRSTRSRKRIARRRRVLSLAAVLAVLAAVAVVAMSAGGSPPSGPLSASEVTGAAQAFASAYGHRDAAALTRVLAADVTRVSPTVVQRGRAAVLGEYLQQFDHTAIRGYELRGMQVIAGWVGRLAARYTVPLEGGGALTGDVVFGVQRANGHVVIGLITTQPIG